MCGLQMSRFTFKKTVISYPPPGSLMSLVSLSVGRCDAFSFFPNQTTKDSKLHKEGTKVPTKLERVCQRDMMNF